MKLRQQLVCFLAKQLEGSERPRMVAQALKVGPVVLFRYGGLSICLRICF
jgi:hypothetical protein